MTDPSDRDYLDDDEDLEQGDETDEQRIARFDAQQAAHEEEVKQWLLREMAHTESDIRTIIHEHFKANRTFPLTVEEAADIDKVESAVRVVIKNQTWIGLDNSLVRTTRGIKCLHTVNDKVDRMQSRAAMMQLSLPLQEETID